MEVKELAELVQKRGAYRAGDLGGQLRQLRRPALLLLAVVRDVVSCFFCDRHVSAAKRAVSSRVWAKKEKTKRRVPQKYSESR